MRGIRRDDDRPAQAQGIEPGLPIRGSPKVLAKYCVDRPVYTLKAGDVKRAAARLVLRGVTVENRELVVTLGL
jgi:hypothetical protein